MNFMSQNKHYVISSVIGMVVALGICITNDIFALETSAEVFTVLSNAFAIPGFVMFGIGIMIWVTNEGLFNGISYGLKITGRSFSARKGEKIKDEEFYEYNARQNEKHHEFKHLLIIGGVFILLSILFACLYGM